MTARLTDDFSVDIESFNDGRKRHAMTATIEAPTLPSFAILRLLLDDVDGVIESFNDGEVDAIPALAEIAAQVKYARMVADTNMDIGLRCDYCDTVIAVVPTVRMMHQVSGAHRRAHLDGTNLVPTDDGLVPDGYRVEVTVLPVAVSA